MIYTATNQSLMLTLYARIEPNLPKPREFLIKTLNFRLVALGIEVHRKTSNPELMILI